MGRISVDDVYVVTETIEQIEPESILDIGMFFERACILSRKIVDKQIPQETILDGYEFEHKNIGIQSTIYDNIVNTVHIRKYDMAIMAYVERKFAMQIIERIRNSVKYLLVSQNAVDVELLDLFNTLTVSSGDRYFTIISF